MVSGGRTSPAPSLLRSAAAETWTLLFSSALLGTCILGVHLWQELAPSLALSKKSWLTATLALPVATYLLLLAPGAVLHLFMRRSRSPLRRYASHGLILFGALYLLADHTLFQRFGRHVSDVWAYAHLPHAGQAAGDPRAVFMLGLLLIGWSLVTVAGYAGLSHVLHKAIGRVSSFYATTLLSLGLVLGVTLAGAPWYLTKLLPDGFGPRLYASLPLRPESFKNEGVRVPHDPALRRLQQLLTTEYTRLFPLVYRKHEARALGPVSDDTPRLNIALIVAESLRSTQLSPEQMPRLYAWSEKGLRAERHYAGSNHSESGLFVLLYGESALRYNTTLDHKAEPTLCRLLRGAGYRCGYFSGHPKKWLRREEFLNETTMDDFVHNDRGTWNDWDENALKQASVALKRNSPYFSLVFLMSSHYEYRYPDKYRRHVPDTAPMVSWLPGEAKREEYEACRNRYLNVTGYLDDLVADHLETLDPKNTILIFTADHGESTGEDGRLGHGYGFSDLLTRVPFVAVGPGILPEVRKELTSHHDLLPTLLHTLGKETPAAALGRPLQAPSRARALLSSYTMLGRPYADALLIHGAHRLKLRIDPFRPVVEVLSFEDSTGRGLSAAPGNEVVDALARAFAEQLEQGSLSVY